MVFKRPGSRNWWYKFNFRAQRIQATARTTNKAAAVQIEAAHRLRLAMGEAGIVQRAKAPTLSEFCIDFLKECVTRHGEEKTGRFYAQQVTFLRRDPVLSGMRLDAIGPEALAQYTTRRRRQVSIATTNRQLATLRRMLRLAAEWGVIQAAPRVRLLPGENPREYVLPRGEEEERYIEGFPEAGGRIVRAILETGLRGGEAVTLKWADITEPGRGRRGFLRVRREVAKSGKARTVPLSEAAWRAISAKPRTPEFVFGAPPPSLVVLEKWHRRVRGKLGMPAEFVLHSLRHTALTRLGEAGVDAFAIREIAGHASVVTSQRYVHPVTEALDRAIGRAETLAAELATERRTKGRRRKRKNAVSPRTRVR